MRALFAIFVVISSIVSGSDSWSFAAEWLYLMPSFDQNAYIWDGTGEMTPASAIATRLGEKQKFYSAYRIEGTRSFCDQRYDAALRYTSFAHSYFVADSYEVANPILGLASSTIISDSRADVTFDRDYRYYALDGLFGLYHKTFGCFKPKFSAGIQFIHLHIKEKAHYGNPLNGARQFIEPDMRAWALGPTVACDMLFSLVDCLNIAGRAALNFSACRNQSQLTFTQNNPGGTRLLVNNSPDFWHAVRGAQARLGLDCTYTTSPTCSIGKVDFNIQGGYELMHEENLCSRIYAIDDVAQGFSFDEWSDFTLMGPYMRLEITY